MSDKSYSEFDSNDFSSFSKSDNSLESFEFVESFKLSDLDESGHFDDLNGTRDFKAVKFKFSDLFSTLSLFLISIKRQIFVGFVSAFICSSIVGFFAFSIGQNSVKYSYSQAYERTLNLYFIELDELIGLSVHQGLSSVRINSRAIVNMRSDLQGSLNSISGSLNSEVDRLERQLDDSSTDEELLETIGLLNIVWSNEKSQIELRIREVLSEFDFEL